MPLVPFGEYTPDQPDFQNPGSSSIINALPKTKNSYGPMPNLSSITGALTARCQGAAFMRDRSANVWGIAGDASHLYKYVSDSANWTDISRLDVAKTITAITKANPGQVTATGHGYSTNDVVYISGVVGMTQVNGLRFTITVVDANNFTIGVDTTAYTTYTSGGTSQKALYYTTAADTSVSMTQFGERILTTNYTDPIQSFVMNTDTAFSNLAAAAPKARYIAVVRDFVMVANTSDGTDGAVPQRVWWSAIGDATNWPTPGSTTAVQLQSDKQDLLGDGGWNQGIVGGLSSADVAVFQERRIFRGIYAGYPTFFDFRPVDAGRGTPAPGSIIQAGPIVYYLSDSGFFAFDGAQCIPIGDQKVDRTFWSDVDSNYLYRITGAIDPINKIVYWAYPGAQNSGGTPNRILAYHYALGRWSLITSITLEVMLRAMTIGYTLDQLNPFGTLETLPYSLDSRAWTGGKINLAAFDTSHKMGFFNGANLAATLDTSEASLNDEGLAYVNRVWPKVDTGSAQVSVGYRNRLADSIQWGGPTAISTTTGSAGIRSTGLYHRARVTIPAGAYWTHAQGVDFDARAAGRR